jgi:pimeloyl-ACP methyl ester carboxylesterase
MSNTITPTVFYRTLNVEGLEIFYREAGPGDAPTVLLLHGFPSSSYMFRNLIPMLADKYHVVAPDFHASSRRHPSPAWSRAGILRIT